MSAHPWFVGPATKRWRAAGESALLDTPGRISTDQILFREKGKWPSGEEACRSYARAACQVLGVPTAHWVPGMVTIAERETAHNTSHWQINTHDSNAVNVHGLYGGGPAPDGHPGQCSRGGWQCIPQTFAFHHVAGTSLDIYNPVASCAAGMNYIIGSYGIRSDGSDLLTKPLGRGRGSADGFGIQQADPARPPRGY
jgi:hypothetical protein